MKLPWPLSLSAYVKAHNGVANAAARLGMFDAQVYRLLKVLVRPRLPATYQKFMDAGFTIEEMPLPSVLGTRGQAMPTDYPTKGDEEMQCNLERVGLVSAREQPDSPYCRPPIEQQQRRVAKQGPIYKRLVKAILRHPVRDDEEASHVACQIIDRFGWDRAAGIVAEMKAL